MSIHFFFIKFDFTVKADDKIPNIAEIKFPTYNRTIVSMRGAMVRDYERGIFYDQRDVRKGNEYFRYCEGVGDRSENRPKIYSLPQSSFQIQAKTKKKQVRSI